MLLSIQCVGKIIATKNKWIQQKGILDWILTLLWLDLIDPSTTKSFFRGKLREEASLTIFCLSSPSGSYLKQNKKKAGLNNWLYTTINAIIMYFYQHHNIKRSKWSTLWEHGKSIQEWTCWKVELLELDI